MIKLMKMQTQYPFMDDARLAQQARATLKPLPSYTAAT